MIITIKSKVIVLMIDTMGAQMMNLKANDVEYLWQGDSTYWVDRAPTLFPFIGRLWNNSYKFNNKKYYMGIHGFAAAKEFSIIEQREDYVALSLTSDAETLVNYPIDFTLEVAYHVCKDTVKVTYNILNRSRAFMPFAVGGHPGFRVPLVDGEKFEDYYLEFPMLCQPDRVGFTSDLYLSGHDETYPLENGCRIELHHKLFDEDAIILKNMCKEVFLRSKKNKRFVKVSYPQMNYLGIWHSPKTDAPYVCIEPWSSLPARQNVVEEFSCKSDMIHLAPGKTYENTWSITVGESL